MIGVVDEGPEIVSLYGNDAESLKPDPATLEDLDVVLFDIQDIGSRYYTYQATLGFLMERAGAVDTRVVVLDRPNPVNGVQIEGPTLDEAAMGFTGYFRMPIRHGLTLGELVRLFDGENGIGG